MGNSIGLTPESGDFGTAWSLSRLHADAGSELYLGASLYNTSTAPVQLFNSSGNVSAHVSNDNSHVPEGGIQDVWLTNGLYVNMGYLDCCCCTVVVMLHI